MHTFFYSLALPQFFLIFFAKIPFSRVYQPAQQSFPWQISMFKPSEIWGESKKRKRGGGEGKREPPIPLPPVYIFALTPTFARLKHRNLPTKRLLHKLRVYWFLSFTEPFPLQWKIFFLAKTNYSKWGIKFEIQLSAYSWII